MTPCSPSRRTFLQGLAAGSFLAATSYPLTAASPNTPVPHSSRKRAAIIGHTGRGDYGHNLESIFKGLPQIDLVALADPDDKGRAKMIAPFRGVQGYSDWRTLLEKERPQLVSIGMRHSDQHLEVALGCLRAGAHIYMEKPFVSFPAEADELLLEAKRRNLRIAVAHTRRAGTPARELKQAITESMFGELLEMHATGKQDARAGGEDMMVLGTHLFDLMRLFAGDPIACSARIMDRGRLITTQDRRRVLDHVGWVAGDDVSAQFEFAGGVVGTFRSKESARETKGPWGMELVFTRARVRYLCDVEPHVFFMTGSKWSGQGRREEWKPMIRTQLKSIPLPLDPVKDWIESIELQREPECSGANGAWAVEMVMAAYASSLAGKRVTFPLSNRQHPLA